MQWNNEMKRRIRKQEVITKTGWSSSTLRERINDDIFPQPTYEGIIPYWLESDVDEFIEQFFNPSIAEDNRPNVAA